MPKPAAMKLPALKGGACGVLAGQDKEVESHVFRCRHQERKNR